jgi:hypothetical protein
MARSLERNKFILTGAIRMTISGKERRLTINYAKELVADQKRADLLGRGRLWQIARKLNVSKIEGCATRSEGFLKRLADGSYGVFFSKSAPATRQRFTVAHEFAHLVLEKFYPHIGSQNTLPRIGQLGYSIERFVDRIAAELLIPQHLLVNGLMQECQREQRFSGQINKIRVLASLSSHFGVSESAMALRLIELREILAVFLRIMLPDAPDRLRRQGFIKHVSSRRSLALRNHPLTFFPKPRHTIDLLEEQPQTTGSHDIVTESTLGVRVLRASGSIRLQPCGAGRHHEYWIVGWTWNSKEIPGFDDSKQQK